jgi:hypothetical protein
VTQILVAAATACARRKLTVAVQGMNRPVVAAAARGDIAALLDANERQVLVYWADYEWDVGWVTESLEQHPGLTVVYLSPTPWVSLSYARARCMIAPPFVDMLNASLLRRMVSELLNASSNRRRAGDAATIVVD